MEHELKKKGKKCVTNPKARAVIAHAIAADEAAAGRVSVCHKQLWYNPGSVAAAPTTPARIENIRK